MKALVPALACLALALQPACALAAGGGSKAKESFLRLSLLTATVLKPNGGRGVLSVEMGIDAEDPALRDRAELMQPRLRDAYAQSLQAYARRLPAGRLPDAEYIAGQLQRDTDRVVGKPGAKVLIGTIMVN